MSHVHYYFKYDWGSVETLNGWFDWKSLITICGFENWFLFIPSWLKFLFSCLVRRVWSVADTVFLINVNITRIRIRWSWFCKNKRLWNIIKQLRHKINAAFNYCILLLNWIVTAWLNFFLQIQYSCCEHRVFDSLLSSS